MRWRAALSLFTLLLFTGPVSGRADSSANKTGEITNKNTYVNPALSLTVALPGNWHLLGKATEPRPKVQGTGCRGPLCGDPEINVSLESKSDSGPTQAIFLGGYKLAPEYLNRTRYPLKKFAEAMTSGSLGANWIPLGDLTSVVLGGRPAYRLIARNRNVFAQQAFAYVSESKRLCVSTSRNGAIEPSGPAIGDRKLAIR
jgi:hypothetical protein